MNVDSTQMKMRIDQGERETFNEIQRLTKELSQTRTNLKSKEDELSLLKMSGSQSQLSKVSKNEAEKLLAENKGLKQMVEQLEQHLQEAEEG